MLDLRFKFVILFLGSIFLLESYFSKNFIRAKSYIYNSNNKLEVGSEYEEKNTIFSLNQHQFELNIQDELKDSRNKVIKFLVNNNQANENELIIDIESDLQYEQNNIFYAEGNVIIYLSDAFITGDKASYDRQNNLFIIEGNVKFTKGSQYFEASKISYNFKNENGFINDIYGVLDLENINNDLNLESSKQINEYKSYEENNVDELEYINAATLGLVNDFEEDRQFNLTQVSLEIPQITRWRFKTDKMYIESDEIKSRNIYFTNDAYNEPQFILQSKNFSVKETDDKLKIVSRNSWIILENSVSVPIGRRTIFDKEPLTKWGFGSDYEDKDGFFISRGFGSINILGGYSLTLRPYFLVQRALRGNTDSFRQKDASILSGKVEDQKISFLDIFGLDVEILNEFNSWDLEINSSFNSLNLDRLSESNRSKLTLTKTIDLYESENQIIIPDGDDNNEAFSNNIDLQFYITYREKVFKGFSGEAEIYRGTGFTVAKRKLDHNDTKTTYLAYIYDLGLFTAEKFDQELGTLSRNVFVVNYTHEFPIWQKQFLDSEINNNYLYSPEVIEQGLNWKTGITSGIFLYGDGSHQEGITFYTGPQITLGSFTNSFFDYTYFQAIGTFVAKGNQSPFKFDDIDDTNRIQFNFEQQLFGPLVFGYSSYLNLDPNHEDYGKIKKQNFNLEISRRAYSLAAYYEPSNETLGIRFNIYNFDYEGLSPKF